MSNECVLSVEWQDHLTCLRVLKEKRIQFNEPLVSWARVAFTAESGLFHHYTWPRNGYFDKRRLGIANHPPCFLLLCQTNLFLKPFSNRVIIFYIVLCDVKVSFFLKTSMQKCMEMEMLITTCTEGAVRGMDGVSKENTCQLGPDHFKKGFSLFPKYDKSVRLFWFIYFMDNFFCSTE